MTKVCHITTVHSLKDDRIFYKQCISLAKNGYVVYLVVTNEKEEVINGINIIPLKKTRGRIHRIFIKSFSAFRKALKTKSKIYHFHDPELIFIGILLRIWGKKVIFDSHENVSKQILSKNWVGNRTVRKIASFFYRIIEKFGIWTFNKVISVTPEIVAFLSPKKGVLIRNFPIISLIDKAPFDKKFDRPTFIYAGGLSEIRGIKEVCEAISKIDKDIQLILLGNWSNESYKESCLSYSKEKIKYLGAFPMDQIYTYLKMSHYGIATLYPEENYLNSLPIKSFEYMACKIPIIMSNFPYWKQNYDNHALFVDPKNIENIKEKMLFLINNSNLAAKWAKVDTKL